MPATIPRRLAFCLIATMLAGCVSAGPTLPLAWPAATWATAAPEMQGLDSAQLAGALVRIEHEQLAVRSLLVIRNGFLVSAAYFDPYQAETPVRLQSVTKSVISALVGVAITRGYLQGVDQKLIEFFPERTIANLDANKRAITLKHLLTMTSGFDCADNAGTTDAMMRSSDWVQFMLDQPMAEAPGKTFRYCSGNAHLLSVILQKATGQTPREFANTALFAPLGLPAVPVAGWATDPQGYADGSSGLYLAPPDMARLGWLYAAQGHWDGQPILPAAWVSDSLTAHIPKGDGSSYGYLWTVYPGQDHAAALGMGGQQLHVYLKHNLVVALTGALPVYDQIPAIAALLQDNILGAVKSDRPLAENPAGGERLRAEIARAADPLQPVAPAPALAASISGRVYRLAENPLGYATVALTFAPGATEAALTINDFPPFAIGLDHLYRLSPNPGTNVQLAARGRWLEDGSFEIESGAVGELGNTRARLIFADDTLTIELTDAVFGGPLFTLQGRTDE